MQYKHSRSGDGRSDLGQLNHPIAVCVCVCAQLYPCISAFYLNTLQHRLVTLRVAASRLVGYIRSSGRILGMLQTSRKGKDLGEVIEERSSGLLKNTGMVLVQQKKNLIIICRGWQCGIWLVEMVSAMLNSWFEFLGQCFFFVLRWRGKNSGTHRPVRVCVCLLVAWTASHCNGHTHTRRFPRFGRTKSHILRRILLTQLLFIYLPVTTQKSLLGWSNRAKNQLWCQFPAVTVSWQLPPSSIGTQIQIHRFMSAVLSL